MNKALEAPLLDCLPVGVELSMILCRNVFPHHLKTRMFTIFFFHYPLQPIPRLHIAASSQGECTVTLLAGQFGQFLYNLE